MFVNQKVQCVVKKRRGCPSRPPLFPLGGGSQGLARLSLFPEAQPSAGGQRLGGRQGQAGWTLCGWPEPWILSLLRAELWPWPLPLENGARRLRGVWPGG